MILSNKTKTEIYGMSYRSSQMNGLDLIKVHGCQTSIQSRIDANKKAANDDHLIGTRRF